MSKHRSTGKAIEQRRAATPEERRERKQRIQTHGRSSVTRSIADAIVVKNGDVFLLTKPDGAVPMDGNHGFGLYYHDCRYLNGYEMKVADTEAEVLVSTAASGFVAVTELTNPDIRMKDGRLIPKEEFCIKWERIIDDSGLSLSETITFRNYGLEQIEFPVSFSFRADFEPLFAVRGLLPEKPGKPRSPGWKDGVLSFSYDGADGIYRSLSVRFSPEPQTKDDTTARFQISLQPEESKQICITLCIGESKGPGQVEPVAQQQLELDNIQINLNKTSDESVLRQTEIKSDSLLLNNIIDRSLRDLHMLKTKIEGQQFFAAGVPWFVTLFGRDSIIASLQMLAYDPEIAEHTLRLIAGYQGQKVDDWRDEEPGKIMHELRIGEMANLNEIPQTPYYGTIDATPLFLILVCRHAEWTGDLKVFNDLRSNIEAALAWMSKYGDKNGDGYIEYMSSSEKGLINQGWKDSGDAIVNSDGGLARPPISLVEVQGYTYLAKMGLADLFERAGEGDIASRLRGEAGKLRRSFNRDFWMEDKGCFALALEADNRPVRVISSNPGHALWAGIADEGKARQTVERLMAGDMFNGWGIRTLSDKERRYNPIGYHLGTIWPHDNSIIAAGMRRYGFDEEAARLFAGITDAAMYFEHYRLPELFAGFDRKNYGVPVRYPVACHPQAWAAGSVPFLTETMLGLVPQAFERKLRIVRPVLPGFVDRIDVRRMRVASARVDLHFEKSKERGVAVEVLKVDGNLDIEVATEEADFKG